MVSYKSWGFSRLLSGLSGVASFSGFAWPKTTLMPETERGLTSEFGMGSGGSRALWPAALECGGLFSSLSFRSCLGLSSANLFAVSQQFIN